MFEEQKQFFPAFYESEAETYDESRYGSLYGRLFERLHQNALREILKANNQSNVLEVAAGTGHATQILVKMGFDTTAIDITEGMLRQAQNKLVREENRAKIVICDAYQLPFKDNSYDIVVSTRFMHLWSCSNQVRLLTEMSRVLKTRGMLIVDYDNKYHDIMYRLPIYIYRYISNKGRKIAEYYNSMWKAKEMMRCRGLRIERVVGVAGYHLLLLTMISKTLGLALGKVCYKWPFSIISEQFIVVGIKE